MQAKTLDETEVTMSSDIDATYLHREVRRIFKGQKIGSEKMSELLVNLLALNK